jgi:hypothetical protein
MGEDVRQVQELLKRAGFDPGPIDGVFGSITEAAVRQFQTSRGLESDGKVGPMTMAALTASSVPAGATRGRSLHIGLNVVDAAAYPIRVPELRGCENDARDMLALAQARGFTGSMMLSSQATSTAVTEAIRVAAEELRSGDFFLLSYSGHGGQLRDLGGDEPDQLDETWVLYDRQLLDDELYALWGYFQAGVRILVLSDSCHSGTVTRLFPGGPISREVDVAYDSLQQTFANTTRGFVSRSATRGMAPDSAQLAVLEQAVSDAIPQVAGELYRARRSASAATAREQRLRQIVLDTTTMSFRDAGLPDDEPPRTRNLPDDVSDADREARGQLYRSVKAATSEPTPPSARVLLVSGCQDNQLSLDGRKNGLFTQRLIEVWDGGRFAGADYVELHRQILTRMPPQQTPNLFWATPRDPAFEAQQPFTV